MSDPEGQKGVLKVIKNPKRSWRFDKEVEALRRLASPNVPKLLDTGQDPRGRPWLVTADCGTALNTIEGTSFVQRVKWFADIAQAVRDAHAAGVLHRDIKPSNIVIAYDADRAYLVDFGICTLVEIDSRTTMEALGNAAFAAPECLLGSTEEATAASDVYSLGKLLYWLVSDGKYIFRENVNNLEAGLVATSPNAHARVLSLIRACVRATQQDRLAADALLSKAHAVHDYSNTLALEEARGEFRLVDNFGSENQFNSGSSRGIASADISKDDLRRVALVGDLQGNAGLAERFENRTGATRQVREVVFAFSGFSWDSRIRVRLVQDENGSPTGATLGEESLSLAEGGAQIYSVPLEAPVPPGLFWVALTAVEGSKTYASLYAASDEVAPQLSTFAESYDGGATWQVRKSPRGPGYAVRILAT